jgi:hypothetical protein
MQRFDGALGGLRSTLLAACGLGCGLGVGACTPSSQQPAEPEAEPPTKVFTEQEPKRDDTKTSAALCPDSTVMLGSTGQETGYIRCADGAVNRQSVIGCAVPITSPACQGNEDSRSCDTAANCTERPHGFCESGWGQIGTYCSCVYPCLDDAECGPDQACLCPGIKENGPSVAECAPAECKVNADCASGECGATVHFNGCGHELALTCRGPGDACRGDEACEHGDCATLDRDGDSAGFRCETYSCAIGRPLTVESGVRVAGLGTRRWGTTRLEGLSPARARADYWLGVARMEHASVASFARFVHELLRFGAPPDLLADALAAAADEVRHAEQTFAIASAYAGEPIGPGALCIDGLSATRDPEVFVTRLIIEGCVGETLGVAEALALLEQDLDPVLRSRLEQIAADETRHAALAWRTLRWFAARVDPAIIERAFERAILQVEHIDEETSDPIHGRLGSVATRQVRALAIASVITPCRRQLRCAGQPASEADLTV